VRVAGGLNSSRANLVYEGIDSL